MSSKKHDSRLLKVLRDYRVTSEVTSKVVEEYLTALDCPRSLAILILFRNKEYQQIADFKVNPDNYESMVACRDAYAATKFLSKYKGLTLGSDLDKAAMQKFDLFELLCKQTNARFRNLSLDPLFQGPVVWLHNAVIRKIGRILGEFTTEEFFSSPDWGPGASTLIKSRDASSVKKFQCETGTTRDLYNLVPLELLEEKYPLWSKQLRLSGFPTLEVGNKVITVPKDAKTNRVIAVEPGINLWFQKSIGDMVRKRLLRCGLDLRWQSRNQLLAKEGSLTNLLATVDLSSASDSIACSVVEELIPPRWYHVMDASRSHYGTQNSQLRRWEKFSSMGNGFTFELESLIFYAVAICCTEYLHISTTDVSAYGDDVILPSACFELFSRMMDFYGFRINLDKSFVSSNFRESCGAHYFLGSDLKPVYLKDRLSSCLSVFRLANAIRRLSHRRSGNYGCEIGFRKPFELLVHAVPKPIRLRIPEGLGDGGFISNFDEATPSRARFGVEGYRFVNAVAASSTRVDETPGYLIAKLWELRNRKDYSPRLEAGRYLAVGKYPPWLEAHVRLEATGDLSPQNPSSLYNSIAVRGSTVTKFARSLTQQWYDLGPWF